MEFYGTNNSTQLLTLYCDLCSKSNVPVNNNRPSVDLRLNGLLDILVSRVYE